MCCSADAVYFKFCCGNLYSRYHGIHMGSQYIRSYIWDCMIAGIHFSFSGYFCAYGKSGISFLHNVLSIVLIRIPGAYFASKWFIDTLYPMGCAAPAGSLLSVIVCGIAFIYLKKKEKTMSILIKDTTKEERAKIVEESIGNIAGACDGCSVGIVEMYQDYIDGKKELREINMEFRAGYISEIRR